MNTHDLNPLESRIRSWTPRRPSPGLEARIFGSAAGNSAAIEARGRSPGWGWLAPVACAFVLLLQLAVPDWDESRSRGGAASLELAGLSNRTVTAFAPGWANAAMNNINGETFESTNWTTAPSPMRTLPVFLTLTNGLIQ